MRFSASDALEEEEISWVVSWALVATVVVIAGAAAPVVVIRSVVTTTASASAEGCEGGGVISEPGTGLAVIALTLNVSSTMSRPVAVV